MIGNKISPILEEIEAAIIDHEYFVQTPPDFSEDGFRAALKIFTCAMLDKMWKMQIDDKMDLNDRNNMATKLGEELSKLIHIYTGVDTKKLYSINED